MYKEIDKTIIRIVQDFCFDSNASILCSEFVITLAPLFVAAIEKNKLDFRSFKNIVHKRKDFFVVNDLDFDLFCKELYEKLNYELAFSEKDSFYDSILQFKSKMENGHFKDFPQQKTSEGMLRSTLSMYIKEETFCEPRSGAGNNDITVPVEKVIIETKLWRGKKYYNSGFPELNDYLRKANYNEGYYIIFDYNKKSNEVIREKTEVFDETYEDKLIHVIFIKMNAISPSQLYKVQAEVKE